MYISLCACYIAGIGFFFFFFREPPLFPGGLGARLCLFPPSVPWWIRVLAIYQILLGWKTYKYYETDELLNPRLNQSKKNHVKSGILSHNKYFFCGLGLVLYRKQTTRNLILPNSPETPYYCTLCVASICCSTLCAFRWPCLLTPGLFS